MDHSIVIYNRAEIAACVSEGVNVWKEFKLL